MTVKSKLERGSYCVCASRDGGCGWQWQLDVKFLKMAFNSYSITAKALYANNPVSPPYAFTLLRAIAPTITNIKDAAGVEIPANTTTFSTTVTLTGIGAAGQQIEISDDAIGRGTVPATHGIWALTNRLAVKAYSFKARGALWHQSGIGGAGFQRSTLGRGL